MRTEMLELEFFLEHTAMRILMGDYDKSIKSAIIEFMSNLAGGDLAGAKIA